MCTWQIPTNDCVCIKRIFLQILFTDHCKACICIDGQIFCYWQCDETTPDTIDADAEDAEPQSTSTANSNDK